MRRSKKKSFREVIQKPCGEQSPYWKWLDFHSKNVEGEIVEPAEANPDILPESAHLWSSKLNDDDEDKSQMILSYMHRLPPKEREVIELLSRGYTLDQAALRMHLEKNTVWGKLQRARQKIKRFLRHDRVI
jgi:DNA-directed RNA polymerase specialized sigma24 family protein